MQMKGTLMNIRELTENEITLELFKDFRRHQKVEKSMRKIDGEWIAVDTVFVDDWGAAEYEELVRCLKNTVHTGGVVYAAFEGVRLLGFSSVESGFFGSEKQYLELSSMHVSEEMRGKGIGKRLFYCASEWAKNHGARKLYISSQSSVETQGFYRSVGCREAEEYSAIHVEKEPCDCQLEADV